MWMWEAALLFCEGVVNFGARERARQATTPSLHLGPPVPPSRRADADALIVVFRRRRFTVGKNVFGIHVPRDLFAC
jgi:hypothetical protein